MPKFRIGLVQTVTEEATLFIEAESREEAEEMAVRKAYEGEIKWSFLEAADPVSVVTADLVG